MKFALPTTSSRQLWVSVLLLSSVFCALIVFARAMYTGKVYYLFLLWNLFLAWIPLSISSGMKNAKSLPLGGFLFLFGVWMLFFPNAPYILTDLFHLRHTGGVPLWFDLFMILSFAWTGLMLGFHSLSQILELLGKYLSRPFYFLAMGGIFLLTGFGIYLGRYQRWNTWDILTQPTELAMDVLNHIIHPIAHYKSSVFSLCFAMFLGMAYLTFVVLTPQLHPARLNAK